MDLIDADMLGKDRETLCAVIPSLEDVEKVARDRP